MLPPRLFLSRFAVAAAVAVVPLAAQVPRATVRAPAIAGFQEAGSCAPDAGITVPGKKGLLLRLEQR